MSARLVYLDGVEMPIDEAMQRLGVARRSVHIERLPDGTVACGGIPLRVVESLEPDIPEREQIARALEQTR